MGLVENSIEWRQDMHLVKTDSTKVYDRSSAAERLTRVGEERVSLYACQSVSPVRPRGVGVV